MCKLKGIMGKEFALIYIYVRRHQMCVWDSVHSTEMMDFKIHYICTLMLAHSMLLGASRTDRAKPWGESRRAGSRWKRGRKERPRERCRCCPRSPPPLLLLLPGAPSYSGALQIAYCTGYQTLNTTPSEKERDRQKDRKNNAEETNKDVWTRCWTKTKLKPDPLKG